MLTALAAQGDFQRLRAPPVPAFVLAVEHDSIRAVSVNEKTPLRAHAERRGNGVEARRRLSVAIRRIRYRAPKRALRRVPPQTRQPLACLPRFRRRKMVALVAMQRNESCRPPARNRCFRRRISMPISMPLAPRYWCASSSTMNCQRAPRPPVEQGAVVGTDKPGIPASSSWSTEMWGDARRISSRKTNSPDRRSSRPRSGVAPIVLGVFGRLANVLPETSVQTPMLPRVTPRRCCQGARAGRWQARFIGYRIMARTPGSSSSPARCWRYNSNKIG